MIFVTVDAVSLFEIIVLETYFAKNCLIMHEEIRKNFSLSKNNFTQDKVQLTNTLRDMKNPVSRRK